MEKSEWPLAVFMVSVVILIGFLAWLKMAC